MFILTILCHVQVIHLLFNRAEAKDSIHELNAAEQMKENMKLKDQIMAKDVEISLLKESLIENGMTLTLFKIVFCHQFQKLEQPECYNRHPSTMQCRQHFYGHT